MNSRHFKVHVVEDEIEIRELMALHLSRQGYQVVESGSSEEALEKMKSQNFDLLVLDWMLPGLSGVEFLDRMRTLRLNPRVLMVTAKAEPQDIVFGLEKGADDYLTKPFDPSVFLARVKVLLRRNASEDFVQDIFEFSGLKINFDSYDVTLKGQPLHLTPSEYKLLAVLIQAQGRVLTRDQLIERVQGEGISVTGRTIDTHIFGLRKKLAEWADHIDTIRGIGYRYKSDATQAL
jgi:two-component system, OmpR family, phosphate regulon response regulator PhoB